MCAKEQTPGTEYGIDDTDLQSLQITVISTSQGLTIGLIQ